MPLKPMERAYRMMQPLGVANEKRIETERYVEGYATTFDTPYLLFKDSNGVEYFEVIERHALDNADMTDVILQYDHAGKVMARTTNKTLIVEPNDKGLFMCADLDKSRAAQDLYEEITNQLITKMSWAFRITKEAYDKAKHTIYVQKVEKVFDVSAVSIPANAGTEISARAFVNGVIDAQQREALELRKKLLQMRIRTGGTL